MGWIPRTPTPSGVFTSGSPATVATFAEAGSALVGLSWHNSTANDLRIRLEHKKAAAVKGASEQLVRAGESFLNSDMPIWTLGEADEIVQAYFVTGIGATVTTCTNDFTPAILDKETV